MPPEGLAPAVSSRIAAVTVFRSGATVERVAELVPQDGSYPDAVRLPGLPLCLDDGTVRLAITAAGEGASGSGGPPPVEASDVRVVLEVPEEDRTLCPPADEELREARAAMLRIERSIAAREKLRAQLEELKAPARPPGAEGAPPPPSPAAARLALLEFRGGELERLLDEVRELRQELEGARERLRELEDRENRASTARQAREHELRKSVLVRLHTNGAAAVPCRLSVSYQVPGARWLPGYTLRFTPAFDRAELAFRALVCQASGEDWTGVDLTVSTAEPQRFTQLPELSALRIGRRQPAPPRTGWREPPAGADELFADYDRAREKPAPSPPKKPIPKQRIPRAKEQRMVRPDVRSIDLSGPAMAGMAAPLDPDDDTAEVLLDATAEALLVEPSPAEALSLTQTGARRSRRTLALKKLGLAPPSGEPELAAPEDLLDYGRLRLRGADESDRGKLRPGDPQEAYLEILSLFEVDVRFNVLMSIRRAEDRAARPRLLKPPPSYLVPESWEGFAHAYRAEAPVDLASDASFHNVALLVREAETELRYVTVPREAQEVFRAVSFKNPLSAPLPQGPADVYVGDDFLLTTKLDVVAPEGATELGLGVEEAIRVARNTRFREETSGLLRGRLGLAHEIRVELKNSLPREAVCEVRERVPVAREGDDDVTVTVGEAEPPWERFEQPRRPVDGGYRWRVRLEAGEKKALTASYTIHLAAKHELVGGNRRDR